MPCGVLGSDATGRPFVNKGGASWRSELSAQGDLRKLYHGGRPSWMHAQKMRFSQLVRITDRQLHLRQHTDHSVTTWPSAIPGAEGACSAPGSRTEPEVGVCVALTLYPSHPSPHTATTAVFQTTFIFSKSALTLCDNSTALLSCEREGKDQAAIRQTRLAPWSWPSHLQGENTSLLLIGNQVSDSCSCSCLCCLTLLQARLRWAHSWANNMAGPISGKISSHKDLKPCVMVLGGGASSHEGGVHMKHQCSQTPSSFLPPSKGELDPRHQREVLPSAP